MIFVSDLLTECDHLSIHPENTVHWSCPVTMCGTEWLAGWVPPPSRVFRRWFGGFVYQGRWILAERAW